MEEALTNAGRKRDSVRAVCLGVSGVNHPKDQERILNWLSGVYGKEVKVYVENDAVAALASGTLGKLHGCVLISGTGCISYGFTQDRNQARAAGGGPVLGDWGSGYGIAARALTAILMAHDGRGQPTKLTNTILQKLQLPSPDELIGWTYADPSWARIAALVPEVVYCADAGDEIAISILKDAVHDLTLTIKAVVQRLGLADEDGRGSFPIVMVGGVLEANEKWDIGKQVIDSVLMTYPNASPIRPMVEPAVGAALLAWNFLNQDKDNAIFSR
jgi:N-acetylglucosamine kinase-like BadF-type ATPase